LTAFSGTGSIWGYLANIVTDIDVTAAGNPGTVAVLGNNLTHPTGAGMTALGGGSRVPVSSGLAAALRTNTQGVPDYGAIDAGIEDNGVLRDVRGNAGGLSALSRLDRDILDRPGIGTVIVTEGLTDLLNGAIANTLSSVGYTELATLLNAWGVTVIFASLTPCDGYSPCTAAVDSARTAVNTWIGGQSTFLAPFLSNVDFNAAVAVDDPDSSSTPAEQKLGTGAAPADYDSGDHVNLTNDGYAALTASIPLTGLVDNTPPAY